MRFPPGWRRRRGRDHWLRQWEHYGYGLLLARRDRDSLRYHRWTLHDQQRQVSFSAVKLKDVLVWWVTERLLE